MNHHLRLPLLLAATALLGGCADLSMSRTGFIEDYGALEPSDEHRVWGVPDDVDIWVADDLAGKYDSVIVEPTVYRLQDGAEHDASPEKVESLTGFFDEELERILGKELEIVSTPGPRTARVRASISEVHPANVWLNWLGLILVVPPDMGGVAGELEVVDATTGSPQLAMTAVREGTPFLLLECFTKYGHARHGMYKWARLLRSEMTP